MAESREQTSEAFKVSTPEDGYRWLATETVRTAFEDYVSFLRKPDFDKELDVIRQQGDAIRGLYQTAKDYEAWAKETKPSEEEVKNFLSLMKSEYREIIEELKDNSPFGLMPADLQHSYPYATWKRIKNARTIKGICRAAYIAQRSYSAYLTRAINANKHRKAIGKHIEDFVNSDQFTLYTGGKLAPSEFFKEARRQANETLG